jgi:tRNA(fMet)-specific endonuclease VapC
MRLLVLDTDHFSEWERASAAGNRLRSRLEKARPDMAVAVITLEEQMRGWLAEIGRHHDPHRQIIAYAKFQRQVEIFAHWTILPWDAESTGLFLNFRRQGVRIGSMDLKIACITLAHDATLLTRNTRDFAQVPNLRLENWLE